MRKIEKEIIEAIKARKPYSNNNTRVSVSSDGDFLKVELHGHVIAEIWDKSIQLSDCGYQTKTTKSRLNCLLSHFDLPTVYSKDYQWYIGSDIWLGSKTFSLINEPKPREYDAVLSGKK